MLVKILIYYQLQKNNFNNNRGVKTPFKNKTMHYRITTQDSQIIREKDYFKAYTYSLFNKCILEKVNGSGVGIEINNFTNL